MHSPDEAAMSLLQEEFDTKFVDVSFLSQECMAITCEPSFIATGVEFNKHCSFMFETKLLSIFKMSSVKKYNFHKKLTCVYMLCGKY